MTLKYTKWYLLNELRNELDQNVGHIMILDEGKNDITSKIIDFLRRNIPSSDLTIISNLKKGSTDIVDSLLRMAHTKRTKLQQHGLKKKYIRKG